MMLYETMIASISFGANYHPSSFNPAFSSSPKMAGYTSSPPRSLLHLSYISFDLQLLRFLARLLTHSLPPASSISFLAVLAFASHSLPASSPSSVYYHHLFLSHVHIILLHLPLPFYPTFPSNPTSPSAPPYSFYPLISLLTLSSPWLFQFFLKLPFHSLSNTMSHFHITLLIVHNCDKPSLSFSKKPPM